MLPYWSYQLSIPALLLLQLVARLLYRLYLRQTLTRYTAIACIYCTNAAGIAHDLMLECCAIGEGRRACPSLLGDLRIRPVLPETGYDVPLDRYVTYCNVYTIQYIHTYL
jgi:hypothetical protein